MVLKLNTYLKRAIVKNKILTFYVLFFMEICVVFSQTTLIRTFKNGNPAGVEVHDLHIVYNKPITELPRWEPVLNPQANVVGTLRTTLGENTIHVDFNRSLRPGETVAIAATTNSEGLEIRKWWWTKKDKSKVTRSYKIGRRTFSHSEYKGWMRGDEIWEKEDKDDAYAIINKNHHWGGEERIENKVEIEMNVHHFLKNAPDGIHSDTLKTLLEKVAKQWSDATNKDLFSRLPKAGQGNGENEIPENHGPTNDPAVMAPGKSHQGANGKKFRSLTLREAGAARIKYPKGLLIQVIDKAGRTGDIHVRWNSKLGPLGTGIPVAGDRSIKGRTTRGQIQIRKKPPRRRSWHIANDKDDDGYITNKDDDVVKDDEYDLYSVLKHEIGHVICFYHSGNTQHFDEETTYQNLKPLENVLIGEAPYAMLRGDFNLENRDVLFFADVRPGGYGGYDIWRADWKETRWEITNLGPNVNSNYDETDPHLASDESLLLFASNRPYENKGGFDLFASVIDSLYEGWSIAENLGTTLNSPDDEFHPSLSADMGSLYFSSNRKNGIGGYDIWRSEYVHGLGYTHPYNLGESVNSTENEKSASISSDNRSIFFSSDRSEGEGGYDIWLSHFNDEWSAPKNLGKKVNSNFDEIDPAIRLDGDYLYFSSNRNTQEEEKHRIYEIELKKIVHKNGLPLWILLIFLLVVFFGTWWAMRRNQNYQKSIN